MRNLRRSSSNFKVPFNSLEGEEKEKATKDFTYGSLWVPEGESTSDVWGQACEDDPLKEADKDTAYEKAPLQATGSDKYSTHHSCDRFLTSTSNDGPKSAHLNSPVVTVDHKTSNDASDWLLYSPNWKTVTTATHVIQSPMFSPSESYVNIESLSDGRDKCINLNETYVIEDDSSLAIDTALTFRNSESQDVCPGLINESNENTNNGNNTFSCNDIEKCFPRLSHSDDNFRKRNSLDALNSPDTPNLVSKSSTLLNTACKNISKIDEALTMPRNNVNCLADDLEWLYLEEGTKMVKSTKKKKLYDESLLENSTADFITEGPILGSKSNAKTAQGYDKESRKNTLAAGQCSTSKDLELTGNASSNVRIIDPNQTEGYKNSNWKKKRRSSCLFKPLDTISSCSPDNHHQSTQSSNWKILDEEKSKEVKSSSINKKRDFFSAQTSITHEMKENINEKKNKRRSSNIFKQDSVSKNSNYFEPKCSEEIFDLNDHSNIMKENVLEKKNKRRSSSSFKAQTFRTKKVSESKTCEKVPNRKKEKTVSSRFKDSTKVLSEENYQGFGSYPLGDIGNKIGEQMVCHLNNESTQELFLNSLRFCEEESELQHLSSITQISIEEIENDEIDEELFNLSSMKNIPCPSQAKPNRKSWNLNKRNEDDSVVKGKNTQGVKKGRGTKGQKQISGLLPPSTPSPSKEANDSNNDITLVTSPAIEVTEELENLYRNKKIHPPRFFQTMVNNQRRASFPTDTFFKEPMFQIFRF